MTSEPIYDPFTSRLLVRASLSHSPPSVVRFRPHHFVSIFIIMSKSNSDEFTPEKGGYSVDDRRSQEDGYQDATRGIEVPGSNTALHRGLKARHITMIAIGGAIGTGLIIGTGKALATSGPGSIFIAYSLIGFLVFLVMAALGEMAAWLPMGSGFTGYASRFASPSLGFALGWT